MSIVATAPVLVPLATAGLTALFSGRSRTQQAISFVGVLGFLGAAVTLLAQVSASGPVGVSFGDWPAPYGIQFRFDGLSTALLLLTALMGLVTLIFLGSDADPGPRHRLLLPLLHGTLAGVAGAFSTADLFNLYVWFEVMLICALGLIALGGRRDQLDAAFKYLGLNLFGTLLLLAAIGLLYAATGQLNYGGLALAARQLDPALLHTLLAALTVGLLLKAGAFPLYAWLPASYPTLPAPVLALFAALLGKVAAAPLGKLETRVTAASGPQLSRRRSRRFFRPIPVPLLVPPKPWPSSATVTCTCPSSSRASSQRVPSPGLGSSPCLIAFSTSVCKAIDGSATSCSASGTSIRTASRSPMRMRRISR